jgi:hypothetical protein
MIAAFRLHNRQTVALLFFFLCRLSLRWQVG